MNVRERVKLVLKMCGHALVVTIHERLDRMEPRLSELRAQNVELAETQNAVLESSIHTVEALQQIRKITGEEWEGFNALKNATERMEALVADIGTLKAGMERMQDLVRDVGLLKAGMEHMKGVAEDVREVRRESEALRAMLQASMSAGETSQQIVADFVSSLRDRGDIPK